MQQYITPIVKSNNSINENNIYIKREDLYPIAFGGNKARIAQRVIEDAKKAECNHVISYGSVTSNMNRAVANLCSIHGFQCTIICSEEEQLSEKTNNSVVVELCGANVVYCKKSNVAQTVEKVCEKIKRSGDNPYYIYGNKFGKGNEIITSVAYLDVYDEIIDQEKKIGFNFDYIFLATGTGMTQSGLIVGNSIRGEQHKIVGISVARKKEQEIPIIIEKVNQFKNSFEIKNIDSDEVHLYDKVIGDGYGQADKRVLHTIENELLIDGIPLDITYTGKAFLGMLDYLKEKQIKRKKILFIHTGGTPLFWDDIYKINNK